MNVPNAITIIRILLVPLFLYEVLDRDFAFATVVYVTAAVTDGLDGAIARLWNMRTRLGTFLDPLADKLLVTTSYVVLGIVGIIPLWLSLAVVTRDFIIVTGSLVIHLLMHHLSIRPHPVGKITTFLQFTLVLVVLLSASPWRAILPGFIADGSGALALATGGFTVLSGVIYIFQGVRSLEGKI